MVDFVSMVDGSQQRSVDVEIVFVFEVGKTTDAEAATQGEFECVKGCPFSSDEDHVRGTMSNEAPGCVLVDPVVVVPSPSTTNTIGARRCSYETIPERWTPRHPESGPRR
jgi:hypothetical protein